MTQLTHVQFERIYYLVLINTLHYIVSHSRLSFFKGLFFIQGNHLILFLAVIKITFDNNNVKNATKIKSYLQNI